MADVGYFHLVCRTIFVDGLDGIGWGTLGRGMLQCWQNSENQPPQFNSILVVDCTDTPLQDWDGVQIKSGCSWWMSRKRSRRLRYILIFRTI